MDTGTVPLRRLLVRGDVVAVQRGRLTVSSASGKPVPPEWLAVNERPLIAEAAALVGVLALEYVGHTVGNYAVGNPRRRAGGLTLQFRCTRTGQPWYAVFNVETTRSRTTTHGKAGEPLPRGHFRVTRRHAFCAFWKATGLPMRRLSSLYDYIGNLTPLFFTGQPGVDERLTAGTLAPLEIEADQLRLAANLPGNSRTITGQVPDNSRTSAPDKETPQRQRPRGIQPDQSTGQKKHGKTVTREHGYTGSRTVPELQSVDDWLNDYDRAAGS